MSREIYKCSYCKYETLKKYNLSRHMVAKHEKENKNNIIEDYNSVIKDCKNVNINSDNECIKCNKKMSSKYYLKKHLEKCKGIINTLECPKCNKIFSHRSSKCNHMKKCKGISNELIVINGMNEMKEMN